MNPIPVNSAAVINFGFKAIFNLLANSIKFDITGLTTFNSGGQSAILGIAFSVVDPGGVQIATIDWNAPQINPLNTNVAIINMVSGFAKFGYYKIIGVLRDVGSIDHTITLIKEICQPENFDGQYVPGKYEVIVDCAAPELTITEVTKHFYKELRPSASPIRVGTLSYPPGTASPLSITNNPIAITGSGNVFTGRYTVNNITTALYDLQDNVFVQVAYKTTAFEKVINCTTQLATVLCCIKSLFTDYCNDPYGVVGKAAKAKYDQVQWAIQIAIIQEKAGFDSGDMVAFISKALNCDCNCVDSILTQTL